MTMEVERRCYRKRRAPMESAHDNPLDEVASTNRHSFTIQCNGIRLVFIEREPSSRNEPYQCRFSLLSYDADGDYANLGLGKEQQNDCQSFADAVEKEMLYLQEKREAMVAWIKECERIVGAIDGFAEALPRILLEDGVE